MSSPFGPAIARKQDYALRFGWRWWIPYAAVMEHTQDSVPPTAPVQEKDIHCLGHLRWIFLLLDSLHRCGGERDKAGNRQLFYDDYVKLAMVYVWNPAITSIRDLQQAAALPKVAQALGIKPFSLGSFSESPRVFDHAGIPKPKVTRR